MSHTWEHGKTRFIGNSDLSGDVAIYDIATGPRNASYIGQVPGEDLVAFVQERMDEQIIDRAESVDIAALELAKKVLRFEETELGPIETSLELAKALLVTRRRLTTVSNTAHMLLREMAIAGLVKIGTSPAEAERIVAQVEVRLD